MPATAWSRIANVVPVPRALQSIRFRLSLAFSIVVFSVGSFLIAGIYLYQVNQLAEPVLQTQPIVIMDPTSGQPVESTINLVFPEEAQRFVVEQIEQEAYRRALHELRSATLASMFVLFLASFGAGWLFAGWTLKPMERISGVAQYITANDLNRRISMHGPDDELKALADTFDQMLDRLQAAFEDQRRFAHEASHELRNPLAVARTNLELSLGGTSEEEVRAGATVALGATERMSTLIEELLEQARSGVPELHHGPADLTRLLGDTADEFAAAAEQRGISVRTEFGETSAPVVIRGDGPALRRAVANLVSNAVRLAPSNSTITLAVHEEATEAVITVADEGPGIPAAQLHQVFDRFWRGNDAGAGSGLGLSIVRGVVQRHGGTVSVQSVCAEQSVDGAASANVSTHADRSATMTTPDALNPEQPVKIGRLGTDQVGSVFTLRLPLVTVRS